MFESLVVTLREGIEAALVVGIILAYLKKDGLQQLNKYVNWGLIAGVGASIIGAVLFNLIGLDGDNKLYEGIMYFISAFFVITMVIWMWKTSKNLRNEMIGKLDQIVSNKDSGNKIGLFLFTFIMILREGIETVLFLAALGKGNSPAMSLVGSVIGLVIAVVIGIFLVYGSLKINISMFFKITGIALILLALKLLAGGVLEFGDAHIFALGEFDKILAFVAEGVSSQIITFALVSIPLVAFLYSSIKSTNLKQNSHI